jgi:hypothetical protein
MSNQITIKTNNQARYVLRSYDLTEKERKEFDYLDDEQIEYASFFRYKGQVYDLGEFSLILPADYKGPVAIMVALHDTNSNFKGWQGYASDSYFSGILIKYTDNYCESVIVGRYYS